VSFDFNVAYSSRWGYSLIKTQKLKKMKSDMKLGRKKSMGAESQAWGTIQLVPKSWKMAIIVPRRRGGTWEGMPVSIWCSEWICRMRRGLVHYSIMIPAALSLPLLRGLSISSTYIISKWLILYQNLQFFPVSIFFRLLARAKQNEQKKLCYLVNRFISSILLIVQYKYVPEILFSRIWSSAQDHADWSYYSF